MNKQEILTKSVKSITPYGAQAMYGERVFTNREVLLCTIPRTLLIISGLALAYTAKKELGSTFSDIAVSTPFIVYHLANFIISYNYRLNRSIAYRLNNPYDLNLCVHVISFGTGVLLQLFLALSS